MHSLCQWRAVRGPDFSNVTIGSTSPTLGARGGADSRPVSNLLRHNLWGDTRAPASSHTLGRKDACTGFSQPQRYTTLGCRQSGLGALGIPWPSSLILSTGKLKPREGK